MNEFKEGDEVWFLIEEHGWGSCPIFINNLNIRKEKIITPDSELLECTRLEGAAHSDTLYKSKNEVINALINQLEAMKDDN